MTRTITSPLLAILLAVLTLTACAKEKKAHNGVEGDNRWENFPVTVRADEFLLNDGLAQEDLLAAVKFWEERAGRQLFHIGVWRSGVAPYSGEASDPSDILENVIFFQNPWPFEERIAGKTILISKDGIIQKAAVFLNTKTALCSGLCIDEPGRTSRRKLLAHELGHFLGFPHIDDRSNVMYPEILPGGSLDEVSADIVLLRNLTR